MYSDNAYIIYKKSLCRGDILIIVENLTKQYGKGDAACVALDKVSVDIPEGKFVTITGKSGSGKTTLLNMIGLIDKPDAGSILVDEKDILKFSRKEVLYYRRNTIGIIFQFFQLINVLCCRDNIIIANEYASKYEKKYFDELVERLDIGQILDKYPEQLSGGQKQRVAIARAMINKPKILLADEPTGNLDSVNSMRVVELMKDVASQYGITLIMVTHDNDIAAKSDIVIQLSDGKKVL